MYSFDCKLIEPTNNCLLLHFLKRIMGAYQRCQCIYTGIEQRHALWISQGIMISSHAKKGMIHSDFTKYILHAVEL